MRGAGGNRIYPADLTREDFASAVLAGLDELERWARDSERVLDLAEVSVETVRTRLGTISISVTADLADRKEADQ